MISLATFVAYCQQRWPQAQALALALQQQHGLEPNLLLLVCWAEQQRQFLDSEQIRLLDNAQRQWATQMLQPYRQLRQLGKQHLPEADYQQMLALELTLEKRSQHLLVRALQRLQPSPQGDNLAALLAALNLQLPASQHQQLQQLFYRTELP